MPQHRGAMDGTRTGGSPHPCPFVFSPWARPTDSLCASASLRAYCSAAKCATPSEHMAIAYGTAGQQMPDETAMTSVPYHHSRIGVIAGMSGSQTILSSLLNLACAVALTIKKHGRITIAANHRAVTISIALRMLRRFNQLRDAERVGRGGDAWMIGGGAG